MLPFPAGHWNDDGVMMAGQLPGYMKNDLVTLGLMVSWLVIEIAQFILLKQHADISFLVSL